MAIKIDIQKTSEEFTIGSQNYTVDFSDEKINEYNALINVMAKKIESTKNVVATDSGDKIFDATKNEMKEFSEALFGKGSFDEIYKECGKSSLVMANVMANVIDEAQKQMDIFKERNRLQKKNEYYKKKNK